MRSGFFFAHDNTATAPSGCSRVIAISLRPPWLIVGYNNKVANNTTGTMKRMMCPSFIKVGEKDPGFYISDLKFDGYQNVEYYFSHDLTGFAANLLQPDGSPLATYKWVDEYNDETETWSGGRWYHDESAKFIGEDGEPDVDVEPGDALWCYAPKFRANDTSECWSMIFPGLNAK